MSNVIAYTADGITDVKELIRSMVSNLIGDGTPIKGTAVEHMKLIYPADGSLDFEDSSGWPDDVLVILEATTNIDPFADPDAGTPGQKPTIGTDPWRIAFHTSKWTGRSSKNASALVPDPISVNSLAVYVGTPSTMSVDASGNLSIGWITSNAQKLMFLKGETPEVYRTTYVGKDLVEPIGNTGALWTNSFDPNPNTTKFQTAPTTFYNSPAKWDGPDVTIADQLFLNKYVTVGPRANSFGGFPADSAFSQPNSYRIVLTNHGLFIGVWGPDPEENGKGFSWLLVQRPVDKKTGIVRGLNTLNGLPYTGLEVDPDGNKIPIGNRPLFCVNSVNGKYWKFIVREHDNSIPGTRKDATINTPDSGAVINPYQQQSLTENGEYVITFLNNLNTSRFKYSDELDMLGTVSSDVVGGGSQINVSVYSEQERRAYHALWSSGSFGTKMRIMVVSDIPSPNTPWASEEEPPIEEPPIEEPPIEEPPADGGGTGG